MDRQQLIDKLHPESVTHATETLWLNWGTVSNWLRIWVSDEDALICYHPNRETEYQRCEVVNLSKLVPYFLSQL